MRSLAWPVAATLAFASVASADEKLESHRDEQSWGLLLESGLALGSQTSLQGRAGAFFFDISLDANVWLNNHIALGLRWGDGVNASLGGCNVNSTDPQTNCLSVATSYLEPEVVVASRWFHRGSFSLDGMLSASIGWARKKTYLSYPGDTAKGGTPDKLLMTEQGTGASTAASIDLGVSHLEVRAMLRVRTEVGNYSVGPYIAAGVTF